MICALYKKETKKLTVYKFYYVLYVYKYNLSIFCKVFVIYVYVQVLEKAIRSKIAAMKFKEKKLLEYIL